VFPQQWHLAKTSIGGQVINASANVAAAHALTRGEQVTIAIIDTGIDIDHEEFASAGKIVDRATSAAPTTTRGPSRGKTTAPHEPG
jgi:subtilisin family serine protease